MNDIPIFMMKQEKSAAEPVGGASQARLYAVLGEGEVGRAVPDVGRDLDDQANED